MIIVRSIAHASQLYMTLYAANSSEISAPVIVALGIIAFTFSMLEVLLDAMFSETWVAVSFEQRGGEDNEIVEATR